MAIQAPRRKTAVRRELEKLLKDADKELGKLKAAAERADKDLSRVLTMTGTELVKTIRTAEQEILRVAKLLGEKPPRAKAPQKKWAAKKAAKKARKRVAKKKAVPKKKAARRKTAKVSKKPTTAKKPVQREVAASPASPTTE